MTGITFLSAFLVLISFIYLLPAQSPQQTHDEFYYHRPSILITSASGATNRESSIEQEVTDAITRCVADFGCFDILNRKGIAHLFEADTSQHWKLLNDSVLFSIGGLAFANEMMVVDIVSFWQQAQSSRRNRGKGKDRNQTRRPDRLTADLQNDVPEDSVLQKNQIQTHLEVKIRILDIDASESLETLTIEINHTMVSREESRAGAIEKLRNFTLRELKKIYLLSPEIIDAKNKNVILDLGSNAGIKKGMLFLIRKPDQLEEYFDEIIAIPGKSIAIVSSDEILTESTNTTILRQNGYILPEYRAFEFPKIIYGLRISFSPAIVDSMMSLDAQFFWHPIQKWSFGVGMRLIRVTDSYGDNDFGVGFEGLGGMHLFSLPKIRVGGILSLNFDLPFRKDDENNTVYLPIISSQLSLQVDLMHYWKSDISIFAGYRISVPRKSWQISDDNETGRSVYWDNTAPQVNISGFFIQLGYKFLIL